jgi:Reverse transcriptase (RNA-dependent DNA polymerase)/Endonuclease-reverse transcriptase
LLNVHSARNKLADLETEVSDSLGRPKFEAIFLTETWFSDSFPNCDFPPFFKTNYSIYRSDRVVSGGGGVAILISRHLSSSLVNYVSEFNIDYLIVEVFMSRGSPLILSLFYRTGTDVAVAENMSRVFDDLCSKHKSIVLCGDFNYRSIDWHTIAPTDNSQRSTEVFCKSVSKNSLTQHVFEPTHILGGTLNLVFSSIGTTVENVVVETVHFSDHFSVAFNIPSSVSCPKVVTHRNFFKSDFSSLEIFLANVDWSQVFSSCAVIDDFWKAFKLVINYAIEQFVPLSKNGFARSSVSKHTRALVRNRRRCVKKHGHAALKIKVLNRAIKLSRRRDAQETEGAVLRGNKNKLFWNFVNSKLKITDSVGALVDQNGVVISDDFNKAQVLNKCFHSVFTRDDGRSPNLVPFISLVPFSIPKFEDVNVFRKLLKRPMKASCGPDGIPPIFYKRLAVVLAEPLSQIFRVSFITKAIPMEWKSARVIPVYKGRGLKKSPANYRPISLTVDACKTMEELIKDCLIDFIEHNNWFSSSQHGFRKGKSTVSNLLETVHSWLSALDRGSEVDVIYLDVAKAFDTVCHSKLLLKLTKLGVPNMVVDWIAAFLAHRSQVTVVNGTESDPVPVSSGVPQGSVLGPILFLIYLNDIAECVAHGKLEIFADDSKIFIVASAVGCIQLQDDLDAIHRWSVDWQLDLSKEKCKVLKVSRFVGRNTVYFPYKLGGLELEYVSEIRDLGIKINSPFSFNSHFREITISANCAANSIHRCFSIKSPKFLNEMFCTYVRPKLEYASSCWNPYLLKDIRLIESVQRRFTKRIPGLKSLSYSDRLKFLELPTLERRRLILGLVLFYKILSGSVKSDLEKVISRSNSKCRGHERKIVPMFAKTDLFKNSFLPRMIEIWNDLPAEIVSASSVSAFQTAVNRCDLRKYLSFPD